MCSVVLLPPAPKVLRSPAPMGNGACNAQAGQQRRRNQTPLSHQLRRRFFSSGAEILLRHKRKIFRRALQVPAAWRSARHGHLPGLLVPGLRSGRVLLVPPGGPPGADGVDLHLLVAAVLAAEGRIPSVHEDVAVAAQRLGAERARVQRRRGGLAERLGVEEEGGGHAGAGGVASLATAALSLAGFACCAAASGGRRTGGGLGEVR